MTLCIAALADDRKAIVMAADRMVSTAFIESELELSKIMPIDDNWWVMIAADNVAGAFPIIDNIKTLMPQEADCKIDEIVSIVSDCYQQERRNRAEAQFLMPRGFTVASFLAQGKDVLPEITFRELDLALSSYNLGVNLLICGFDHQKVAHLFTVDNPGIGSRLDIPGFHAIGSGFYGAQYMMYYRELSSVTPVHEWLYYIYEAKAFGEQAGAVGEETELLIARPDQPIQRIDHDGFHESLDRMWAEYRPGILRGRDKGVLKRMAVPKSVLDSAANEVALAKEESS